MYFAIEDILEEMARENITHFSPHYVCHRANIADLKGVTEYLLDEVRRGKLKVFLEVECPEGDSDFAVSSIDELTTEPRHCHICGTEYIPDKDKIWIAFDFTTEFKEFLKKKSLNLLSLQVVI